MIDFNEIERKLRREMENPRLIVLHEKDRRLKFEQINGFRRIYRGYTFKDRYHGIGELVVEDWGTFLGYWKDDFLTYGLFKGENGDRYAGDWDCLARHGYGKQKGREYTYEGQWKRNARCGEGRLELIDGNIIDGTWSADLPLHARWTTPDGETIDIRDYSINGIQMVFLPESGPEFMSDYDYETGEYYMSAEYTAFTFQNGEGYRCTIPTIAPIGQNYPSSSAPLMFLPEEIILEGAPEPHILLPEYRIHFDPDWVIQLVLEQYPHRTDIQEGLRHCTEYTNGHDAQGRDTMEFPDSLETHYLHPFSAIESLVLFHPSSGEIVLEVFEDGRIYRIVESR